jgi:hypothetical protein
MSDEIDQWVALSNIKLISTTRDGDEIFTVKRRLERVDATLRDIESATRRPSSKPKQVVKELKEAKEPKVEEQVIKHVITDEITPAKDSTQFAFSMQYSEPTDILNIMQAIIREENNLSGVSQVDCEHCTSADFLQTKQLSDLAEWRKHQMAKVLHLTADGSRQPLVSEQQDTGTRTTSTSTLLQTRRTVEIEYDTDIARN